MTAPDQPTPTRFRSFYILPGTQVGTYVVRDAIGQGGGQMAYLADSQDGRTVVLKFSLYPKGEEGSPEREMHERFLRQVGFFLQLRCHPNVAHVYAHDMYPDASESGHLYMVQEWVPSTVNFLDWYRKEPRTLENVLAGFIALGTLCAEMHQRGICHRDLKPENILMVLPGGPKLIDFDSGWALGTEPITAPGAGRWPGTKLYYSPEVCEAILADWATMTRTPYEYRPPADLHALGVIFYQVLTGEYAFDAGEDDLALYQSIACQVPKRPKALNPQVPFGLDRVTMKLLKKNPKLRYQTGYELVDDLYPLINTKEDWSRPFQTPAGKRPSLPSS